MMLSLTIATIPSIIKGYLIKGKIIWTTKSKNHIQNLLLPLISLDKLLNTGFCFLYYYHQHKKVFFFHLKNNKDCLSASPSLQFSLHVCSPFTVIFFQGLVSTRSSQSLSFHPLLNPMESALTLTCHQHASYQCCQWQLCTSSHLTFQKYLAQSTVLFPEVLFSFAFQGTILSWFYFSLLALTSPNLLLPECLDLSSLAPLETTSISCLQCQLHADNFHNYTSDQDLSPAL